MNLIPDLDTVLAKITVISRDSQNNVTPEISVLMGGKKNLLQDEIFEYSITKGRIWVVFYYHVLLRVDDTDKILSQVIYNLILMQGNPVKKLFIDEITRWERLV